MKAKLLSFLAIIALATSFSYAKNNDETRIIILEALDNEKTRSVIDIPIQVQIQGENIQIQINECIGTTIIKIISNTGRIAYMNQIFGSIQKYNIGLSIGDQNESYKILIYSQQGNYIGELTL